MSKPMLASPALGHCQNARSKGASELQLGQ